MEDGEEKPIAFASRTSSDAEARQKQNSRRKQHLLLVVDDLPVHAGDIAHITRKDPVLSRVREFTLNGWLARVDDEALRPFLVRRTELSEEQGCVL